jgi:flagellar motor switch protein FliM
MAESRALSQWEIDALLNQIPESGESIDPGLARPGRPASRSERSFGRAIKPYDFRRPDKFSKEQWHTLQAMHETFARLVSGAFSSRLRSLVTVRLSSIDQELYEEWQSQVTGQTVCYVLAMPPLEGNIVLEFNSEVASEALDRLLGGNGLLVDRGREMREIEISLLRSFASSLTKSLEESWAVVAPVEPELKDIGLDAALIQIAGPNDVVVTVFFEVSLGNQLGSMSICIPYTVLEPIANRLSQGVWHLTASQRRPGVRSNRVLQALIGAAELDVSVELGTASVQVETVLDLQVGDTLLLDQRLDRPLPLLIEGKPRFWTRPGQMGNKLGVRVGELIEEREYELNERDLADVGIGISPVSVPAPHPEPVLPRAYVSSIPTPLPVVEADIASNEHKEAASA